MRVTCTWTRLLVAAGMLLAAAPASASEFHPVAGAPDNGNTADGICTLREAITAANETTPQPDCSPSTGSGLDTIVLSAGTYDLAGPAAEDANASGDLDVLGDIVINGAGAGSTTIDAHGADRIFDTYGGISATISGVTLKNGKAPNGANGTTGVGGAGESGGAIRAGGDLTLDGVTLSANAAGDGGSGGTSGTTGMSGGPGGPGGAIDADAALTIRNSTVSGNSAGNGGNGGASGPGINDTAGTGANAGNGGGIQAAGATTIENSTVSGNHSGTGGTGGTSATGTPGNGGPSGFGGGINISAALTLSHTTVSSNSTGNGGAAGPASNNGSATGGFAAGGGGIAASPASGEVHISDSIITGNHTGDGGSGPPYVEFAPSGGPGGGYFSSFGTTTIERTTISGNRTGNGAPGSTAGSGGDGGGIVMLGISGLILRDSTVSANQTGDGGDSGNNPGRGGNGGGLSMLISSSKSLDAVNTTVTGNTTGHGGNSTFATQTYGGHGGIGGGIYLNAKATLTHLTVAGNQTGAGGSGEVPGPRGPAGGIQFANSAQTLTNSVVASNAPSNCNVAAATLTDGGHNVSFGDTSCPGINGDPLLQALADNGGPTQTIALSEGSSAIDLVPSDANCAATDQRGTARPQRAACDAGAYEATPPPPATGGDQPPLVNITLPTDKTPPVIKLLLTRQKLLKALKKGYFAFFSDNEIGTATADLFASGKDAKGTAARRKRVAHGSLKITHSGKQKLVLKFTKKAKKAFKKRRKVTFQLVLTAKDGAGNTTKKSAKVTLKR